MKTIHNFYIDELDRGAELVIVAKGRNYNSSIFWKDENGTFYSFSREFGAFRRDEYNNERMIEHIKKMLAERAEIFVRGTR